MCSYGKKQTILPSQWKSLFRPRQAHGGYPQTPTFFDNYRYKNLIKNQDYKKSEFNAQWHFAIIFFFPVSVRFFVSVGGQRPSVILNLYPPLFTFFLSLNAKWHFATIFLSYLYLSSLDRGGERRSVILNLYPPLFYFFLLT